MTIQRRSMHHRAIRAVSTTTGWLGSFIVICLVLVIVGAWAVGLLFVKDGIFNVGYVSLITSVATIGTFIMVFIIQSTQNRESRAMQTKLDALLIAKLGLDEGALLGLEGKPDATIKDVQTDVHTAERRAAEERGRIVVSPDVAVRPSEHHIPG